MPTIFNILPRKPTRIFIVTTLLFFIFNQTQVCAQEPPPRPMSIHVNPEQGLVFGAFFHGNAGGSIIIYPDGSRSTTGSVIQANLGYPFSPAIFEIDANPGTLVSIMNGPDIMLTGSNGGSMLLRIGNASTGAQFITTIEPPSRTQVRIGGTLEIGNNMVNPPGDYSGFFSVTFIQE